MSCKLERDLNSRMEFDHVVQVLGNGSIVDRDDLYAPECSDDGEGGIDFAGAKEWEALNGYSGQDSYAGPIMHPSEFIGGALERDILGEPGVYVAVVVTDLDAEGGVDDAAGWAVLRYSAPLCPDCGRPITQQRSGWWTHDGLPNGCWRLSLDGPHPD